MSGWLNLTSLSPSVVMSLSPKSFSLPFKGRTRTYTRMLLGELICVEIYRRLLGELICETATPHQKQYREGVTKKENRHNTRAAPLEIHELFEESSPPFFLVKQHYVGFFHCLRHGFGHWLGSGCAVECVRVCLVLRVCVCLVCAQCVLSA